MVVTRTMPLHAIVLTTGTPPGIVRAPGAALPPPDGVERVFEEATVHGATNRPRVFLSSTVRDFRDLRSALKYWLELLGCDVLVSEHADFARRPEQGTFDSCFAAIADCHYFVLLVGGHRGSEYAEGVSVTQQEYRVAASLARQGRIAPIVFARGEVLTALRERTELGKHSGTPLTSTAATPAVPDPEFIRGFIEEIERTEAARQGEGPAGGTWVYRFDGFRDIADALRATLRLYGSVPRQALLANLGWELREIVAALCGKHRALPQCGHWWVSSLRTAKHLRSDDIARPIPLSSKEAGDLQLFLLLGAPDGQVLPTAALEDAISSREFLIYDQQRGHLEPTPELGAMYRLHAEVERYRRIRTWLGTRQVGLINELQATRHERHTVHVVGHELALAFGLRDAIVNVLRLSHRLLDFIEDPRPGVRLPDLLPPTPFAEDVERIREEEVSHDDIAAWRRHPLIVGMMTGQHEATLPEIADTFRQYPDLAEGLRVSQAFLDLQAEIYEEAANLFAREGMEAAQARLRERFDSLVESVEATKPGSVAESDGSPRSSNR